MKWIKKKPDLTGYYWIRMQVKGFAYQPPRVVLVTTPTWDTKVWVLEPKDDYKDGFELIAISDDFEWSSEPIPSPEES